MKQHVRLVAVLALASFGASNAFATDGYFSNGYSVKSQGIGGIGIALPQDGLAVAENPAGTALVGNRADLGLTWFKPERSTDIVGNGVPGADGSYDGNATSNFFIPEFGYTRQLSSSTALGLAIYGNGGMNTNYSKNPFGAFGSSGSAGVNLEQLFVVPSIAYKLDEKNSFGAALNFAYQRFSAKGLSVFSTSSASPSNLTDKGTDTSTGWGLHLGWIGQVTPEVSLGASWSSKIKAGKFNDYSGLFADGGSFDIPENYGVGIAAKITPKVTLAADVQRINYAGISSIANPLSNLFAGNALGSANGPGFGWRDITVVKVGASYAYSPALDLRVGYNHSGQPIPDSQTFFNILAPGVVQDNLTFGATWKASASGEWSIFYAHGFKNEVNGANSIPTPFGGGNANIGLSQNSLGIAYGWKL
jgi:long-chain fatty acid transport protein